MLLLQSWTFSNDVSLTEKYECVVTQLVRLMEISSFVED